VNLLIRNSQYSTVADPWAASLAYTQQKCAKLWQKYAANFSCM